MWDYPRPPRVEPTPARVRVEFAGAVIADTTAALRVLETSQAPAFYLPPADVALEHLERSDRHTYCEWKGQADYWTVRVADRVAPDAAWSYPRPTAGFEAIAGYLAFYPQAVDACWVDDEQVAPNAGDFYGGWITSTVVGPFKGGPGSLGW